MERIPDTIHKSWHPYLQKLFDNKKMGLMRDNILPRHKFYPANSDIFNVFKMPLDKIKVVILGQDPYPKGEGIGYAFAVNSDTTIPPSLRIIRNEVIESKVERQQDLVDSLEWKTLKHWRQQGIFLLNAALTVEANSSGSHGGHWQWFTKEVINTISNTVKPLWMLWGAKAIGLRDYISGAKCIVRDMEIEVPVEVAIGHDNINYILEAAHPMAEGYDSNTKYKFTGCNHFNLCNKILKVKQQSIINW